MNKPTIVTAALPYANGHIHIGHLVEYIMTDVYVRALRMAGEEAYYICADDTHGTPVELAAMKEGIPPEEFVARSAKDHTEDFARFRIQFDHYGSTNSETNRKWAYSIYESLKSGGYVSEKTISQLYDEEAKRFLPDRFVKGTCPKCKTEDQYGDNCEVCGSKYEPTDLINPYSVVTGSTPVLRESDHLFVNLSAFESMLRDWVNTEGRLNEKTKNFVEGWMSDGLKDWCISRDPPYFGFEIPDKPNKFFYVWLDAPVGYIASTTDWAEKNGHPEKADAFWKNGEARIEHVIGKDIVYFHTLFWPAMLNAAGLTVPDKVHVHGFLQVDGKKMSKRDGTFVMARTFADHIDPIYLRYYYASKLGPEPDDIDLAFEDFVNKVNAELVNNLANLVSRSASFIKTKLTGGYGKLPEGSDEHIEFVKAKVEEAKAAYRRFDLQTAVRCAVEIGDRGNKIFQDATPWKTFKDTPDETRATVTLCLNMARAATALVAPVVPSFSDKVYGILGLEAPPKSFDEATRFDLVDRPIGTPERIVDRITRKQIDKMVEASRPKDAQPEKAKKKGGKKKAEPETPKEITIDDFLKVELRVGLIKSAEDVDGSKKLLKLAVDLGEGRDRTIFAGIKAAYAPADLVGKKVCVASNLAPRKMKFGTSEGMVLAAGEGGEDIQVLDVPSNAKPGSIIR